MLLEDQHKLLEQLDDFLSRRGLKISFIARQIKVSPSTVYNFRAGSRLLSRRKAQTLQDFMDNYDRKLGDDIHKLSDL